MGTATAPVPGAYSCLATGQQKKIQQWLSHLAEHQAEVTEVPCQHKTGLWIYGPRRSGTSYLASVAVKRAVRISDRHRYGTIDWEYITSSELNAVVRLGWSDYVQKNQGDFDLYREANETEVYLDWLWNGVDLLWVDDITVGATDMNFFEKHMFPLVEHRVKQKKAVVVATSLSTTQLGSDRLAPVVKDLFVACECDRSLWDGADHGAR